MKCKCCQTGICWCKFSLAFGLTNGLIVLAIGLLSTFGHAQTMASSMVASQMYPGFSSTVAGSFMGAFWGFLEVFLFFRISGLIYWMLSACCSSKKCDTTSSEAKCGSKGCTCTCACCKGSEKSCTDDELISCHTKD